MEVIVVVMALFCISLSIHHLLKNRRRLKTLLSSTSDPRTRRVLFITAHPDDECMFFSPTILSFTNSSQYEVFLLCLSTGDYYSQGRVRQKELIQSCQILGIRENHVFIVIHGDLPDDPKVTWSEELLAEVILPYVKDYYIDLIFTFDGYGVSGHVNHQSLCHGVQHMLSRPDCPAGLEVFQLDSTNVVRKYLSILDIGVSYACTSLLFVSRWSDVWKAQEAMQAHRSQMVWFRALYIMFSRYIIINTYSPLIKASLHSNGSHLKQR